MTFLAESIAYVRICHLSRTLVLPLSLAHGPAIAKPRKEAGGRGCASGTVVEAGGGGDVSIELGLVF